MQIITNNIPIINRNDINKEKIEIMNSLLEAVQPLFDEMLPDKKKELDELKNKLNNIQKQSEQVKTIAKKLTIDFELEQSKTKLLNRISKLIKAGVIYDPTLKREVSIILKVIPKMTKEQLEQNSRKILEILNKRFK